MKARDVMTEDVVTLAADTPIPEIARLFRSLNISGAPVVQNGRVVGIVTEMDLIMRQAEPQQPLYFPLLGANLPLGGQREYRETVRRILGIQAADIMTVPVVTVEADTDLDEVATLMVDTSANPLPVVEDGRLVGIVSRTDLIRALAEAEELPDLEEDEEV